MARPVENLMERILSKVQKKKTGCWIWNGGCNKNNYAFIRTGPRGRRKVHRVHRIIYDKFKEKLLPGQLVLHKCDNKKCVNPEHLERGTYSKNIQDAWDRGLRRKKSHGHN